MIERELLERGLPAYEIRGELGRGGFGVVIEGRHRQLGRLVAIKQLPRAFGADPEVSRRFLAEAQILAQLDHPHIVPVYDYVEHEGLCVLVMEKLGGGTLWSRFRAGTIDAPRACGTVLAVLSALDRAHAAGVLHRDIKPDNVIFGDTGIVKVADFGIAKVVSGATRGLTRTGEVLGTPTYMAPEQVRGDELTAAVDLYALSVLLYELLAGVPPFESGSDPLSLLYKHLHDPPTPLPERVPVALGDVVLRGLAKDPFERHESAEAMAVALARAATSVWGSGWSDALDMLLVAPPTVLRALVEPAISSRPNQRDHVELASPFAEVQQADAVIVDVSSDMATRLSELSERLQAHHVAALLEGIEMPTSIVLLGRAGLPLDRALRQLEGNDTGGDAREPSFGDLAFVRGRLVMWAAPLALSGPEPELVARVISQTGIEVAFAADAIGLSAADRRLLTVASGASCVNPLVLNDDLHLSVAADVLALHGHTPAAEMVPVSPWDAAAAVPLLLMLHAECRLALHLLQQADIDAAADLLRERTAQSLHADRAASLALVDTVIRNAVANSVSRSSEVIIGAVSSLEAAALRGSDLVAAIDGAARAALDLAEELTAIWMECERRVGDATRGRAARLAPFLGRTEPLRPLDATPDPQARGIANVAAAPSLMLLPLIRAFVGLRSRIVATRSFDPPIYADEIATAAAAESSVVVSRAASGCDERVDEIRAKLEVCARVVRDDAVARLDRADDAMRLVVERAVAGAGSLTAEGGPNRQAAALEMLANLDEIDALLAALVQEDGG